MTPAARIAACVTPGVSERPYSPAWSYRAFVVHPPRPGLVVLAVAHREGKKLVADLVREGLTVGESAAIVKRYRIAKVTGQVEFGDGLTMAQAILGALYLADRS